VTIKKEFKVGILAFCALLILYFGIDFLKGSDVFNPARKYYVRYDNIDGLTVSNPVMLNGFQVGLVKKIKIRQGEPRPVLIQLEINKEIILGRSSKAILSNNGLLGGKMIVLESGIQGTTLDSDSLIADVAPGLTSMIEDKAQPLVNAVTHLVGNTDKLIDSFGPTVNKLNDALDAVAKLSNSANGMVANSQGDLKKITENIQILTKSLISTEAELNKVMKKMNVLGDSLARADLAGTIHSLHRTTDNLNKTIMALNEGKGSMGKLMKSDSLYRNLNASTTSLNALLVDFKANPKRYVHFSVFGSKDKKTKEKAK
jgi:phospholipid/cholesterol/gamma-HCH transport system substrate-binding protein